MGAPEVKHGNELLIDRAFLTAHLLTASIQQAEDAASNAIDAWNPDEESEETLFQNILLDAAARTSVEPAPDSNPGASGSYLPKELKAILRLTPQLRRCFVLRMLVGLPSELCARLLQLHPDRVDQYLCAAFECLADQV